MEAKYFSACDTPEAWRALLADPGKHWRTGYSAKSLAYCWLEAEGFPHSLRSALDDSPYAPLQNLQFVVGFPEHKVYFPPMGARPSQNDLFVLGRGSDGLVSIAVEGKVSESFDKLVSEWKGQLTPGKDERLNYLCELLQIDRSDVDGVRYQLLHRTASAIIEANRFGARHALMLVHSFSQTHAWFEDYAAFAGLLGVTPALGQVHRVGRRKATSMDGGNAARGQGRPNRAAPTGPTSDVELYLAWVSGEAEFLNR